MKITETSKDTKKQYIDLGYGEVFRYQGDECIKIPRHRGNMSDINYVVLDDGGCGFCPEDEIVEPLDAELIVRGVKE